MSIINLSLDLIAPESCLVCSQEGQALCAICADDSLDPVPPRCFRCLTLTKNFQTCSNCRRHAPIMHAWVAGEYTGVSKTAIKLFKFERRRGLAHPLAGVMVSALPYLPFRPLVVPIPTATSRMRQRGYDHALLLAKEIAAIKGWPCVEALRRQGQTRQVGTGRRGRHQQLAGAFRAVRSELARGKPILLVDDIVTTGATLSEAARTLKAAGCGSIFAVVVAQSS